MISALSPRTHLPAWQVLGSGAVGGLWALRLAAAGHPVTLLRRHPATAVSLHLEDGNARFSHLFPVIALADAEPSDWLLVCTKAGDTQAALAPLLPRLTAQTPLVLLQNGMGADTALIAQRPDLIILPAITTAGVYCRDADTRVQAGHGRTLIGAPSPGHHAPGHYSLGHQPLAHQSLAENVAAQWRAAGMTADAVTDINTQRWHKLAINCAINPLTARWRCRNGELLDNADALALMQQLCAEVAMVMRAEGLAATGDALFAQARAVAAQTAANTSSMLADVLAGRPTEIAFMNGYVLARAQHHGIACPVNAALLAEITALTQP
ncbi:MAG: 2-dehydropantoate 2-reductase [Moraxellaceae bacterium]|nr:2-dehydropantoate 2-reductase [Moraxellaceae bacterium]